MNKTNLRYIGHQEPEEGALYGTTPSVGGQILNFTAAGALNVGDVVVLTAANTVNKATANLQKVIGVVVGGAALPDKGIFEPGLTASAAAIAALITAGVAATTANGQVVQVLIQGIAYIVADAAIANGQPIMASANTAGRVSPATGLVINAGATGVTSSAANGAIIGGADSLTPVIGKLIDAAAAANGDVRLAYINIH